MTELIDINKMENITSLELLEQINMFRKEEGKNEQAHKDLLRIIRDEFEEEIGQGNITPTSYIDQWNREQPMFTLTISEAKQVLVRESKFVRKAVLKYLDNLERAWNSPEMIMKRALEFANQKAQEATQKLLENRHKIDFYDDVTESDTAIDIGTVAKLLNFKGIGRNKLFDILRNKGVLQSNNIPYQRYVDNGYFRVIESKWNDHITGDVKITFKTVVYQKGIEYISKILKELGHIKQEVA